MSILNKLFFLILISIYSYGSIEQKITTLENTTATDATINVGNLKLGQSGIVVHTYNDDQSIIVSSAVVMDSNENQSKIKFTAFDSIKSQALPTSNLKPSNGDIFIVNYLYSQSLLITPNGQTYTDMQKFFPQQSFLSSDIFASYLKLIENPTPQKADFQAFCKKHDLGTIYFVIEDRFYIVDVNSFKVVETLPMINQSNIQESPFYTKVDEIKSGVLDFDFNFDMSFGLDFLQSKQEPKVRADSYNRYYKNLLGIN